MPMSHSKDGMLICDPLGYPRLFTYNYGTEDSLEATLTIIDHKVYMAHWTTTGKTDLRPGTEIWEYLCVPSESDAYNNRRTKPRTGGK